MVVKETCFIFSLSSEQAIIKWTKIGIQSHSYLLPWDYTTFRDNKKQGLVSVDLGSNLHKGLIFQCSAHSNFVPHFNAHCISPGTTEHYVHGENSLSAPFWGSLSITSYVKQRFISYSKLNASSIVKVLQLCSWTPFWIILGMPSPWAQQQTSHYVSYPQTKYLGLTGPAEWYQCPPSSVRAFYSPKFRKQLRWFAQKCVSQPGRHPERMETFSPWNDSIIKQQARPHQKKRGKNGCQTLYFAIS